MNSFSDLYGDTNLTSMDDALCLHPYYHDKELGFHLGAGFTYNNSYFSDNLTVTNVHSTEYTESILSLEINEYRLYTEALHWLQFNQDETANMIFKMKQMNIQQGINRYGNKGKKSAMKEIQNITKNKCFGEIPRGTLTQETKDRALPILMFMIMKRNSDLKSRGVADGRVQGLYTNKNDCSVLTNTGFLCFRVHSSCYS